MEERELPVGWAIAALGEMSEIIRGITFPASAKESSKSETNVCCLRTSNVQAELIWSNVFYVDRSFVKRPNQLVRVGDILMSMANSYDLVGKVSVAKEVPEEAAFGAFLAAIRPIAVSDGRYLFYFLRSESVQRQIRADSSQTTNIANISAGKLREIIAPLAPLNEQRRIAAKLDTTLAAVEACRQRLDGVAAILKRFRQAVLAAATSGELTRGWREQRGVNPEWEVKELSGICLSIADGDHQAPPRADEGIPFITISAINDAALRIEKASRYVPESYYNRLPETRKAREDDILFSVTGSVGIPALVDSQHRFVFQRHIALLRPNKAMVLPRFLYFLLLSEDVNRHCLKVATGTAQLTVSLGSLRGMSLRIPSLQEQTKINERVQHFFTIADQFEARLNAARKVVDRLNPALLAKAFRGELVPQDPNDEPASELLAKLKSAQADALHVSPRRRAKQSTRRQTMSIFDQDSVKAAILNLKTDRFSFDELRDKTGGDYESLKGILFQLLEEPSPVVRQVFDQEAKAMKLERIRP